MDQQRPPLHAAVAFGRLQDFLDNDSAHEQSSAKEQTFLLFQEGSLYRWHLLLNDNYHLLATTCSAMNIGRACHLARMQWGRYGFRTLRCGTLFTLPERDEIGSPALFHEMIQSLAVSNGVVTDPSRGHPYRVDQISEEAVRLYKKIKNHI
jgi:hypothetical protein